MSTLDDAGCDQGDSLVGPRTRAGGVAAPGTASTPGGRAAAPLHLVSGERGARQAPPPEGSFRRASALADLLESSQHALLQRWTLHVRERLASRSELEQLLPGFLRDLVVALRGGQPRAAGERRGPCSGGPHYRPGFALDAALREYELLRTLLLDRVEQSACALSLSEMRILADSFSAGIAGAVEEHARQAANTQPPAEHAYLLAVLESAPVAIILADACGRVLLANKRAETELGAPTPAGFHPEDDRHWRAVRPDGTPLPLEDYPLLRALRGLSARGELLCHCLPDGRLSTLEMSYGPVRDAQGQLIGALVTFADVTERRRAEAEQRERAAFEQQLIGIVSHDLRSPLNAVLLGTQALLRREEQDARNLESLRRIQGSAERAVRLVHDLLDFTQARLGGGLRLQRRALDLHEVAHAAVEEVRASFAERTLQLRTEGDGHGQWDGDRLAQLLTNLVVNAVKYSPEGTPVTVCTTSSADAATLEVHNEGTPIPEATLAQLFQPLQRGAAQTDSAQRSVGLGLYIVERVARAHGGRVEVRSAAGEGTRFTVHLPRQPPRDLSR